MIAALFVVVAGGYWHHAAFHVAAIVGWDNDDDDDAHPRELDPGPRPRDVNRAIRLVDLYSAG